DCHQPVRYGTSRDCFRLQRAPPSGHRAGRWSHGPTAVRRAAVWCILQAVALFRIRVAAMKTILVPVEQHSTLPSVLETALFVGRSVAGSIEGFALGPYFRNLITVDTVIAPPILDETAQREMVETAHQRFET